MTDRSPRSGHQPEPQGQTPTPLRTCVALVVGVFAMLVATIEVLGPIETAVGVVLCAVVTLTVLTVRHPPRNPMHEVVRLLEVLARLLKRDQE